MPKNERKYWVVPEKIFSREMDIRDFLKKAGYEIKDGCVVSQFNEDYTLGRVMSDGSVCVDYQEKRISDSNYLLNVMNFIELLAVNGVSYEETASRERIEKDFRKNLARMVKRFKEVPKCNSP